MKTMAKKQNHKNYHTKDEECNFDFSTLLTYCSKNDRERFQNELESSPISAVLLNEALFSKEETDALFPDLVKDDDDPVLYRFNKEEDRMGKTIEHFGGCFYILDPSSAGISFYLQNLLKKDFVCFDMCAAPGGKTIAMDLRRRDGLYLANDLSYDRAMEIDKNAQRMHLDNILSLSMDPMKLKVGPVFDLVIADVPCSGSGMIRKEKKMRKDWSMEKVDRLLPIQADLLDKAYDIANKDGIIAYSTCSLSAEEDEDQVRKFLMNHPDCSLIEIEMEKGMVKGKDGIGYHMIPGIYDGEGIYFALIRKKGEAEALLHPMVKLQLENGRLVFPYRNNVFLVPRMYEELSSLPYIAPGIKKLDKSEHPKCDYDHAYSKITSSVPELPLTREQACSYIQGNELRISETKEDGLYILTYQKMRLGFGKLVQSRVKNYLPKGLRGYLK